MSTTHKTLLAKDGSIFTLSCFLSPAECEAFICAAEEHGFEAAPIGGGTLIAPEVRNNTRVMVDDPELSGQLWERLAPWIPARLFEFHALGLNERFRYYRYDPGEYFRWHGDGAFVRSRYERSLLTAMVYLNDCPEGGTTDFRIGCSVAPRRGAALLFEHQLVHQGAPVVRGLKYVLRTDVMYRWS